MSPTVLAVFGPTGVGKTALALALADRVRAGGGQAVAVSADALQVYAGLETLTGVASAPERARLEHRLVAFLPLTEICTAGRYAALAHAEIDGLLAAGITPIVVGGTGLYLRAALADLKLRPPPPPELRKRWSDRLAAEGAPALHAVLAALDPRAAATVVPADGHRIVRLLELHELSRASGVVTAPDAAQDAHRDRRRDPPAAGAPGGGAGSRGGAGAGGAGGAGGAVGGAGAGGAADGAADGAAGGAADGAAGGAGAGGAAGGAGAGGAGGGAGARGAADGAAPSQLWTRETRHPTRLIGVVRDRADLDARIDARVRAMVDAGAADEVRRADQAGASATARAALGFQELLAGDVEAMQRRTRKYARRQLTWLRKLPDVELVDLTGRDPEAVAAGLLPSRVA